MKRIAWIPAVALLVATCAPAFAGSAASGEKCTKDVQTCLNAWAAKKDMPWVGLRYDKAEDGSVVVKEVIKDSPAAAAGFEVGDVLMALNGAMMNDDAAVKKAKGNWKAGQQVSYTVKRGDTEKELSVTLAKMPEEVFASMLGEHMLTNHATVSLSAATPPSK